MPSYNVLKSDGTTLATVTDLTINSTAATIKFIGRNIVDYGQDIAENQVHIMENFADTTSPLLPIAGQLWWDTNIDVLKVFDGSSFADEWDVDILRYADHGANGQRWTTEEDSDSPTNALVFDYAGTERIRIAPTGLLTSIGGAVFGGTVEVDKLELTDHGSNAQSWTIEEDSSSATNSLTFDYSSTERLRITTSGDFAIDGNNVVLSFSSGGENAVNWVDIEHATTGSGPIIRSVGADTNVDLNISAKGTGVVNIGSGGVKFNAPLNLNGQTLTDVGSFITGDEVVLTFTQGAEEGVNWVDIVTAELSQGPVIRSVGAASNIDLVFDTKGTGDIDVSSNKIVNLATPQSSEDAATKDYVDIEVAGVGAPVPAFRLDAGPATVILPGDGIVVLSSGGAGQTVGLPPVGAAAPGTTFTLKNGIGTTGSIITPAGADTIDGVGGPNAGLLAGPLAFTKLISDGASIWYVA